MSSIKQGATFRATLMFTENEWNGIYPWDEIVPFMSQESVRYELDYEINEDTMSVDITSETYDWKIGPIKFDIWIIRGEYTIPIPNNYSIEMQVIQGGMQS